MTYVALREAEETLHGALANDSSDIMGESNHHGSPFSRT